jgi:hypothetical protein
MLVYLRLKLSLELIDDVVPQACVETGAAEVDPLELQVDLGEGLQED